MHESYRNIQILVKIYIRMHENLTIHHLKGRKMYGRRRHYEVTVFTSYARILTEYELEIVSADRACYSFGVEKK